MVVDFDVNIFGLSAVSLSKVQKYENHPNQLFNPLKDLTFKWTIGRKNFEAWLEEVVAGHVLLRVDLSPGSFLFLLCFLTAVWWPAFLSQTLAWTMVPLLQTRGKPASHGPEQLKLN